MNFTHRYRPVTLILFYSVLCLLVWILNAAPIHAGVIEISGSGSYSSSRIGDSGQQWTRRWSLSVGYYLIGWSELELSFQDVLYRTQVIGIEDTTFHDQISSLDWIQYLAPQNFPIIPYIKTGVGQLNRTASGTYWTGGAPPQTYAVLTAILGAGLKIKLTHSFALKVEGSSYLSGGAIASWKDNFAGNIGFSFYF
jgi:hypothetical protein